MLNSDRLANAARIMNPSGGIHDQAAQVIAFHCRPFEDEQDEGELNQARGAQGTAVCSVR